MKRIVFLFFVVFASVAGLRAEDEKFVDCGPGFIVASSKNRDGIPTVECKPLWCRDLEHAKPMGSGALEARNAAAGYELCEKPAVGDCAPELQEIGDNQNNYVSCWGKIKWCDSREKGIFEPDYGMYVKPGSEPNLYRAVLKGPCYAWQLQDHNCDIAGGEKAVNEGGRWICVREDSGTDNSRSAIKAKAVRRTSGVFRKIKR